MSKHMSVICFLAINCLMMGSSGCNELEHHVPDGAKGTSTTVDARRVYHDSERRRQAAVEYYNAVSSDKADQAAPVSPPSTVISEPKVVMQSMSSGGIITFVLRPGDNDVEFNLLVKLGWLPMSANVQVIEDRCEILVFLVKK